MLRSLLLSVDYFVFRMNKVLEFGVDERILAHLEYSHIFTSCELLQISVERRTCFPVLNIDPAHVSRPGTRKTSREIFKGCYITLRKCHLRAGQVDMFTLPHLGSEHISISAYICACLPACVRACVRTCVRACVCFNVS